MPIIYFPLIQVHLLFCLSLLHLPSFVSQRIVFASAFCRRYSMCRILGRLSGVDKSGCKMVGKEFLMLYRSTATFRTPKKNGL